MDYVKMFSDASKQFEVREKAIQSDTFLTNQGKQANIQIEKGKICDAITIIVEDFKKEISALDCKAKKLPRPSSNKPDMEVMMQENREYKALISRLALVDTPNQFIKTVVAMANGTDIQKNALIINFSKIIEMVEKVFVTSGQRNGLNIWGDEKTPETEKQNVSFNKSQFVGIMDALKSVYSITTQSIKDPKQIQYEKTLANIEDDKKYLAGQYDMAQRLFRQRFPELHIPPLGNIWENPEPTWNEIVRKVSM